MNRLIYISAFFRKELYEILRQPRLLLTLILGPFLILLLFGIGYRNEAAALRTLFVMQPDSPFRLYVEEYMADAGGLVAFAGIVETPETARLELRSNNADVAIVLPDRPVESISNNQPAIFTVLHREIDPFNINYVRVFSRIYVNEVNSRVLATLIGEGQQGTSALELPIEEAKRNASELRQLLADKRTEQLAATNIALARSLTGVAAAYDDNVGVLLSISEQFGDVDSTSQVGGALRRLRDNSVRLSEIDPNKGEFSEEVALSAEIEADLALLSDNLSTFSSVNPNVLVKPFNYNTESVTPEPLALTDFYVPAVIALITQHLAVTFAAMSIVRERNEGALELFRIAPISALETLLGKYFGYVAFDFALALLLTLLVVFALGTPIVGSFTLYLLVLLLLIFASLSVGFFISLIATTTTQAVQYSMIMLLASIFFSGFFLGLQLLWEPVRIVSWLLPATYATHLLQDIMLRGLSPDWAMVRTLTIYGLAFFMLAWLLMRRLMRQR